MFDTKVRESMTFISITCITHAIFRINIQRQFKIIVWLMDQFKIIIPQSSLRVSWCIPSDWNFFFHLLNFGVCIRYRLLNWTHLTLEASIIVLHEFFVMNRSWWVVHILFWTGSKHIVTLWNRHHVMFVLVMIRLNCWQVRPRVVLSLGIDLMPIEFIEHLLLKVSTLEDLFVSTLDTACNTFTLGIMSMIVLLLKLCVMN